MLSSIFTAILPVLIQNAGSILVPLISGLSPTLAAKVPAVAQAAAATSAAKAAAVPAPAVGAPTVTPNPVAFIQEMLVAAGKTVDVDGLLGPQTISAIEQVIGVTVVRGGIVDSIINDVMSKQAQPQ